MNTKHPLLLGLATAIALFAITVNLSAADKLRISYSAVNATQAFLWVAQEKNIFARHGLEG